VKPLILLALAASCLRAQVRPEARAEAVNTGRSYHAEAGVGLTALLNPYLRSTLLVSRDLWHDTGYKSQMRYESQVRFYMGPFAEEGWALSFSGGFGFHEHGYTLLGVDMEGPRTGKVRPAFQVLLGGGTRLALVVRGAGPKRR